MPLPVCARQEKKAIAKRSDKVHLGMAKSNKNLIGYLPDPLILPAEMTGKKDLKRAKEGTKRIEQQGGKKFGQF